MAGVRKVWFITNEPGRSIIGIRESTPLFDLTQLVTEPTRITQTSATLIDHVYASHPEKIVHCLTSSISLSDHFPVSFTRKINSKFPKHKHVTTLYRCFKHFNESYFISELANDLNTFVADKASIDEDFTC